MRIIYRIITAFYYLALRMAAPFHAKASDMIKGRSDTAKRIKKIPKNIDTCIWVHCASVGEFEQGRPLIEKIKAENPKQRLVLSFYSPSGYNLRKNYPLANEVYYLPFDTPKNAKTFIQAINPSIAIFVKYEFWLYHLKFIESINIPVFLISATFRKDQWMFRIGKKLAKEILGIFTHIFLQNKESAELLNSIGLNSYSIAGDTRIDRVLSISKETFNNPIIEAFSKNAKCIIAGSTWPKDEAMLLRYFNETNIPIKLLIVPHEITQKHINQILKRSKGKAILYTNATSKNIKDFDILILDTMGMLSKVYRYADIAYIGGGLGKGIHNTLEAAVYGIPVVFGHNYHKFSEAKDLISKGAGFSVKQYNTLENTLTKLTINQIIRTEAGNAAKQLILDSKGAINRIYEEMQP